MIVVVFSCKKESSIFKGEVFIVDEPDIDTLIGSKVEIDGLYTGSIFAYDSLMFFLSEKYHSAFGCDGLVFNIETGKQITSIVKLGRGPEEFVTACFSLQYDIVNKVIGVWFYDYSKRKNVLVDLTDNSWEKIINLSGLEHERDAPAMRIFVLNDSLIMIYNQGEELYTSENWLSPPSYYIFNYITNKTVASYEFFNGFKYNTEISPPACLNSSDRLKIDRTKLVMAMRYTRQINILDIESGKITGYKVKNSPELDIVREGGQSNLKTFYWRVDVDDDLIYAMINRTVDVYGWDGSFKRRLKFDKRRPIDIALDPVNKYLYMIALENDDEKIYRYDVNYLYK
jgi:hypothetical protein